MQDYQEWSEWQYAASQGDIDDDVIDEKRISMGERTYAYYRQLIENTDPENEAELERVILVRRIGHHLRYEKFNLGR